MFLNLKLFLSYCIVIGLLLKDDYFYVNCVLLPLTLNNRVSVANLGRILVCDRSENQFTMNIYNKVYEFSKLSPTLL